MATYRSAFAVCMLAGLLAAGGPAGNRVEVKEEPRPKVGLLMDTMQEERWQRDRDLFLERAKQMHADVLVESAERDDA
jgi:D-xylose transport system substrate-binding protein